MAQLEDLKRQAAQQAEREARASQSVQFIEPERTVVDDLEVALTLLRQAHIMLGLVSDPELCKVVSKRERATMIKLLDRIAEFTGEVHTALQFEGLEL